MIRLNSESIIYVFCPAYSHTGGIELSHQLVDYLIRKEKKAYIVYIHQNHIIDAPVPTSLSAYKIRSTTNIVDDSNNIVAIPEIYFGFESKYKSIQFAFWWMSVDNFYSNTSIISSLSFLSIKDSFKLIYNRVKRQIPLFNKVTLARLKNVKNNHIHLYQSTYARQFLISKGIYNLLPLSDYVNQDFLLDKVEYPKENIIIFNPKKGYSYTKKIVKALPEYTFIALQDLSRGELLVLMKKSKLYLDFGYHPGKDRLPRETVINKCCIITGIKGSAYFFEDIPIESSYKFNQARCRLKKITNKVKFVMDNYDHCVDDFDFYRKRISLEKEKFFREIDEIFIS